MISCSSRGYPSEDQISMLSSVSRTRIYGIVTIVVTTSSPRERVIQNHLNFVNPIPLCIFPMETSMQGIPRGRLPYFNLCKQESRQPDLRNPTTFFSAH